MFSNPIQLIQMLRNTTNPLDFMINVLSEQMGDNPFFSNLITLAKSNRGNEIESIARNMLRERGLDFDKELTNFKRQYHL